MITDQMIKTQFISSVVSAGIKKIQTIQQDIIRKNLNVISGDLLASVKKIPLEMQDVNKQTFYMTVLPYMRFLDIYFRQDMGLRRNLALYNRTVWGVLYGETQHILRYGLSEDIRKYITAQLQQGKDVDLSNQYSSIEGYDLWQND